MSQRDDYYRILGVKRTASPDDIKRAYRKLAKRHHPDRNPNDPAAEQRFKEVQRAYDVLGEQEKRAQYDRFGEASVGQWTTDPRGKHVYQWGGNSSIRAEDLEDLFSAFGDGGQQPASVFDQLFGGRRAAPPRRPAPKRGLDEERPIALTFEQAVHGAVVTVQLRTGRNDRSETLEVKIPPGVEEGQRIRLSGKGHPGRHGGPPGDFYLACSIQPHTYFERSGADISLDVPLTLSEAALGVKIEVPTIDGRVTVTVPPGTPSGTRLRLKSCGLPKPGSKQRGDQFVNIDIVPPKSLTKEQRRLFEQVREQDAADPRRDCAWAKDGTSNV